MEYVPCIGNSSYSFWWILLKLYRCFKDGLKICILFSQDPEIIFLHFNLDIFSSLYATDMYREYMPCIGNPAYSFRPILLKLYRYFAAFLWFHMRNLSLAGYNCSGGASCMACSFIGFVMLRLISWPISMKVMWPGQGATWWQSELLLTQPEGPSTANKEANQTSQMGRLICIFVVCIWATSLENLFMPYANNEGADQPAHLRSLISAIVAHCLDSIISLVSISEISSLYLASVAEQASLGLTWLQTPKTGFLLTRLLWHKQVLSCLCLCRAR